MALNIFKCFNVSVSMLCMLCSFTTWIIINLFIINFQALESQSHHQLKPYYTLVFVRLFAQKVNNNSWTTTQKKLFFLYRLSIFSKKKVNLIYLNPIQNRNTTSSTFSWQQNRKIYSEKFRFDT